MYPHIEALNCWVGVVRKRRIIVRSKIFDGRNNALKRGKYEGMSFFLLLGD